MAGNQEHWHRRLLEGRTGLFTALVTVGILIGGIVELTPMFAAGGGAVGETDVEPYTPLELAGRDIYIREGCYNCHSQMVRPMRAETVRYGEWSRMEEYRWERPFQLGSRRIGPDLHRTGWQSLERPVPRYNNLWHYNHMLDPRSTSEGSVMPAYPWLANWRIDVDNVTAVVGAMATLGVPYDDVSAEAVEASLQAQAQAIVDDLESTHAGNNADAEALGVEWDHEIVALIAYLQSLGTNFEAATGLTAGGDE